MKKDFITERGQNKFAIVSNIAGICNKERNVFGLMPHPERAYEEILGSTDGKKMIDSFVLAATESKAKLIDA